MKLSAFFTYLGGKHSSIPYYPKPAYDVLIEPFAGSAAYACAYHQRKVRLYDLNPVICGVWDYLIKSTTADILALPTQIEGDLSALKVCQEAQWLIGFWEQRSGVEPMRRTSQSSWMLHNIYWGNEVKARIIQQQPFIRHWQVRCCSYEKIGDIQATWFIDPPYIKQGFGYVYSNAGLDYAALGRWCRKRKGQTLVCEALGAEWLDFQPLRDLKVRANDPYPEMVWYGGLK